MRANFSTKLTKALSIIDNDNNYRPLIWDIDNPNDCSQDMITMLECEFQSRANANKANFNKFLKFANEAIDVDTLVDIISVNLASRDFDDSGEVLYNAIVESL